MFDEKKKNRAKEMIKGETGGGEGASGDALDKDGLDTAEGIDNNNNKKKKKQWKQRGPADELELGGVTQADRLMMMQSFRAMSGMEAKKLNQQEQQQQITRDKRTSPVLGDEDRGGDGGGNRFGGGVSGDHGGSSSVKAPVQVRWFDRVKLSESVPNPPVASPSPRKRGTTTKDSAGAAGGGAGGAGGGQGEEGMTAKEIEYWSKEATLEGLELEIKRAETAVMVTMSYAHQKLNATEEYSTSVRRDRLQAMASLPADSTSFLQTRAPLGAHHHLRATTDEAKRRVASLMGIWSRRVKNRHESAHAPGGTRSSVSTTLSSGNAIGSPVVKSTDVLDLLTGKR